jgi:monoamine oxidase
MVSLTWDGTTGQSGKGAALLAFSGGPAAAMCRKRWFHQGKSAYGSELEKLYPDNSKNLLGDRFMNWPSDKWTQAGYSFPAPEVPKVR